MHGRVRAFHLYVGALVGVASLSVNVASVYAVSVPVTFTIVGTTNDNKVTGTGTAEGVLPGASGSSVLPLNQQPGAGGTTQWTGTVNAHVGFDPVTRAVTRIRFIDAQFDPVDRGNFAPGGWDPVESEFTSGVLEPAEYAYLIPGFVQTAIRQSMLTATSGNNAVAGGSFAANYGLQFTAGTLALNAPNLGNVTNNPLAPQIRQLELATADTYGGQHVGLGVWRENLGTQVINGNNVPIYGDVTPRFSEDGDPVTLYDMTTGLPLPQTFANNAALNASILSTDLGNDNFQLDMTLPVDAKAIFYIGDFEVIFAFAGTLKSTSTVALPVPGDATNDGKVNGADYVQWASNFNQHNITASALYTQGDFNGDGKVDGTDYIIWASRFQGAGSATVPIPEPATLVLALLGAIGAVLMYGRRRGNFPS